VRDEFNSLTYVVRNMASDAFDKTFGNRNKKLLENLANAKVSARQLCVHMNAHSEEMDIMAN